MANKRFRSHLCKPRQEGSHVLPDKKKEITHHPLRQCYHSVHLLGRKITLTAILVLPFTVKSSVTHSNCSRLLVCAQSSHFQASREGKCLAGVPDIVGRCKPDIHNLISLVLAVLVLHFVDGWVPVQGKVLFNVPGIAVGVPQVFIGHLWSHRLVRNRPIEPVDMVGEALPDLRVHQRVGPHEAG